MSPITRSPRKAKVKALNEINTPKKKQNISKSSISTPFLSKFDNLSIKSPSTRNGCVTSPLSGSDKENYQNDHNIIIKKKQNVNGRKKLALSELNKDENLFAPRISSTVTQISEYPLGQSSTTFLPTQNLENMNIEDESCKPGKSSKKRSLIPRKNYSISAMKSIAGEDEAESWTVETKSPMKIILRRSPSRSKTPEIKQKSVKNFGLEKEYESGEDEAPNNDYHGLEDEYDSGGDEKLIKKYPELDEEYESENENVKILNHQGLEDEYDSCGDEESSNKRYGLEMEYNSGDEDDIKDTRYGLEEEYEESDDSDESSVLFGSRNAALLKRNTVETFEEEPEIAEIDLLIKSVSKLELDIMQEDLKADAEMREKRERNPLMKIYPLFHTSALPEVLLKREKQCKEIEKFIKQAVASESSVHNRTIYISGVPGTGKTACVTKVIQKLQSQKKPIIKFSYVYVNGLEMIKPEHVFTEIYKVLYPSSIRSLSSKRAREKLSTLFTFEDSKRVPILLVIDELDMLCTKSQDVIYDIFDWASTSEAKLSVIAIANTLDLPERVLKQRVSSRMGYNRLIFEPYTFDEISHILEYRIKKSGVSFNKAAFGFISRKVASVSGDLRKALEFIRRAIEIAIEKDAKSLSLEHATAAVKEGLQSLPTLFTKSLSLHQELLLRAIIQEIRATSLEELDFFLVYDCYRRNCLTLAKEPMEMCSATGLLSSLQTIGYISVKSNGLISGRISLQISVDEIDYLLKQMKVTEEM
uniref:Origin recognition complex subunit 1 n=1 Tax=Panagrolaimus sp. ES5 TaxID=591445 RepID=A0AC34FJD9_9BILA